jgi:hypothetical protein
MKRVNSLLKELLGTSGENMQGSLNLLRLILDSLLVLLMSQLVVQVKKLSGT